MVNFQDVFMMLDNLGVTDVLLPFILVFTLVFAILQKAKLFGEEKKNINVIVALVMGLGVVIPHVTNSYPPGTDVVDIINSALPQVSVVLIAIIMAMILIGVFWQGTWGTGLISLMIILSFAIIVYIFGEAAHWWEISGFFGFLRDPELQAMIVVILIFGIIIAFITSEPKEKKGEGFKKFTDFMIGKKD